jgi:hypothetical protein
MQMMQGHKADCQAASCAPSMPIPWDASPALHAVQRQPDGNATSQPEREVEHVEASNVRRICGSTCTACSLSSTAPHACASCSRASLPVRIGRRLERCTRRLRHNAADSCGSSHHGGTGRHLDPAAHAFLTKVALSVPSCPAGMQRAQPLILGTVAAVQRPSSGPPARTKCTPVPDIAGGIRELRFALRAADHYGPQQQLKHPSAAAHCGGVD